jgi:hypothetical protein
MWSLSGQLIASIEQTSGWLLPKERLLVQIMIVFFLKGRELSTKIKSNLVVGPEVLIVVHSIKDSFC